MTDVNLKEHSLDKNIDFWQQLKTGYDLFEQTKQDLTVHVVDRRYIIK
jgi:murein L,D-transpeptidase YafK